MSFGYSLVKLVLKLKKEKQSWSQDPIDYIKKRKQDLRIPNKSNLFGNEVETREINECNITTIIPKVIKTEYLILFCHGGAFIYGPTKHHWNAVSKMVRETHTKAWLIDYPKAPENNIQKITKNICEVYNHAVKEYDPSKIIMIGDSVGGNLLTSLTQGLVRDNAETPNLLILITPLMDASLTNTAIKDIDPLDPILSFKGVHSAKKMCAGDFSLKDPLISPLYGSFVNFPKIYLFMATNDILMPDQKLFINKVKDNGGKIEVILGEDMPHIWPFLPFMPEAKKAMHKIISIINEAVNEE
ncbi:alpha/beta hydrolase fold domain-containing protein [Aquimarina celericrescens]|uniref:Alpha/beta hydrolase fold domain-containing protein n=1 Tax=Aquimarina celericrescens TaxID=1964542 RepID=A0ABW5AQN9_9FLAO|nr:alpha/beta hydrolase [Aquimarina celericrescens]